MLKFSKTEDKSYRALMEHTVSILYGTNVDELYCDTLVTLINHKGFRNDRSTVNELITHLQKVFLVSNDKHAKVLAKVESSEVHPLALNVEVVAAEGLKKKNQNGLSNPICTLYISSDRKENTSVKFETLNPVWQECFTLPVCDIEKDVLRVELWNYTGTDTKRTKEIKSNRGLKIFTKDITKSSNGKGAHDFLGCLKLPLMQIPSDGINQWYFLEGKNVSSKKKRGKIHLRLGHGLARERKNMNSYQYILHLMVLYEITCEQNIEPCKWDGVFSNELSRSILKIMEFQGGLTKTNKDISLWIILTQIHCMQFTLNSERFSVLLKEILYPLNIPHLETDEALQFWQATETLVENFIVFFRNSYQYQNSSGSHFDDTKSHVQNMLRTLGLVNSYLISTASAEQNLKHKFPSLNFIVDNMKTAISHCSNKFFNYIAPFNINTQESQVKPMINVLEVLIADLENTIVMYQEDFKELLNVDYFGIQYLCAEIVAPVVAQAFSNPKVLNLKEDTDISHFWKLRKHSEASLPGSKKLGLFTRFEYRKRSDASMCNYEHNQEEDDAYTTLLFKLYIKLMQFSSLSSNVSNAADKFCIRGNFHTWFHNKIIVRWLEIAQFKAMNCIKIAVSQDNLKPLDEFARITSSAVDTAGILQRIEIWNQLSWPEVEASALVSAKIIDDIWGCAVYYSDLIWEHVEQKNNDIRSRFEISDELCFAINNIEKVAEETKFITQSVINEWETGKIECKPGNKVEDKLKLSLESVMENGHENIKSRLNEILEFVGLKMQPGLQILIMEAEKLECENNFTNELENYIEKSLRKLSKALAKSTFDQLFSIIWENVLAAVLSSIINNIENKMHPDAFQRLQNIFADLINVFYSGSPHDIVEVSNSDNVKEIKTLLEINGTSTSQLILKYMRQRHIIQTQLQNAGLSDSACLAVRPYYCEDIQTLKIELLNGRKLKPRDEKGLRDPYVKIIVMTEQQENPLPVLKSKVIRKTLYPLFDDVFSVPLKLSVKEIFNQGVIMFTVKDRALLGCDCYMGDCFVTLETIPHRNSEIEFKDLTQEILPITLPLNEMLNSQIFEAIENRDWDKQALEFTRRERKKLA
ncbi:unnamed protein product [Orchesella dallaii]|uniref:BAI1-associated protein 3 n=1 Tax=Orchesella dallaii TaxID=48710 RepID=A0ABP1PSX7_9HEXA